ncbi:MAG: UDP-glucose/GDP-mannose dehydrogenase family protein [Actinomycetota bacterium]
MKVAVIGVGHVGLVTAATLAHFGHDVVGLDEDAGKIETLQQGKAPFYEPGLQDLLDEVLESGKLRFTREEADAIDGADYVFICVGTPARADGESNLLAVENAARAVARHATGDMVVIQKSTVPVSTADRLHSIFDKTTTHRIRLVSSPEFLREGAAVEDSLKPDRILVGSDDSEAHRLMRELYAAVLGGDCRYFEVDIHTAELAKHACNAFLALKISFANALARVCEASGADVVSVADIMGSDHRIGREFLNAGLGYGGYCFPKDLLAFKAVAGRLGYDFGLLEEVMKINRGALDAAVQKIKNALWNVESKKILLLGLSFKPGTDDVRESPSLNLARALTELGADVVGHDPQANDFAVREFPGLNVVEDLYQGAEGAHCIVVCTEWPQFADLDLVRLKGIVNLPIIVDGRNLLNEKDVVEAGFSYLPTGRPPANL